MTDNPRGNVIEARSIGNGKIVLGLASDRERAVPMLSLTDTYESNWLIELTGAELVRVFRQLESLLTATEADVQEWVEQLRNPQDHALQEGTIMQFKSSQPAPARPDESLVSLAELSIELTNGDANALARQIGSDALVFDDIGRRAVTRSTARVLFAQRAERRAEEARRATLRRQRLAELSTRSLARLPRGIPVQSGDSYVDMVAMDQR